MGGNRFDGEFTAYLFGLDGQIVQRVRLNCADEEAAKQRAQHLAETHTGFS